MGILQKKIGPVFIKEESDAAQFILKMQELLERCTDAKLKTEIENQIRLARYGELGEQNISFELKNSGEDMLILHDLYLEYEDLSAQIDYLIITRKKVFIIECKNLIGNIEIDNQGNFIRTYELAGKKIKEGLYSPITQNQRHLEVLRKVRRDSKRNFIEKKAFDHFFAQNHCSLVVLANPKTYLNAKYAKKEVKEQVIRADQIIERIKAINAECKDYSYTEKEMYELAQFYLSANITERSDYSKKYAELVQRIEENNTKEEQEKICPKCGNKLVIRTATKGSNVGNKFYGCSGFPNCRYIENI